MWQEFIKQLLEVWSTIEYDLINATFGLTLLMVSMLLNQIAGVVMSIISLSFDWKKLGKSILKGLAIAIVVEGLCFVVDLVPVLLVRTKLVGSESIISQLVTTLEIMAMIIVALVKYIKDIYEKLLKLFDVSKEEVDKAVQTTFNNDPSVMDNADVKELG